MIVAEISIIMFSVKSYAVDTIDASMIDLDFPPQKPASTHNFVNIVQLFVVVKIYNISYMINSN